MRNRLLGALRAKVLKPAAREPGEIWITQQLQETRAQDACVYLGAPLSLASRPGHPEHHEIKRPEDHQPQNDSPTRPARPVRLARSKETAQTSPAKKPMRFCRIVESKIHKALKKCLDPWDSQNNQILSTVPRTGSARPNPSQASGTPSTDPS